jgi:hypothetical protein
VTGVTLQLRPWQLLLSPPNEMKQEILVASLGLNIEEQKTISGQNGAGHANS